MTCCRLVSLTCSRVVLCLCLLSATSAANACKLQIGASQASLRVPTRFLSSKDSYAHSLKVFDLVLEKTNADFGPCVLEPVHNNRPSSRNVARFAIGEDFDAISASVTSERDLQLQPIPFPIYRGLMGYRVLLLNVDAGVDFSRVKNLTDLKQFTYGVGGTWTDSKILQKNAFSVVKGADQTSLYRMLQINRYDAMIRASQEVIADRVLLNTLQARVENSLVIAYPLPVNFYVEKNNQRLAKRLGAGLARAQQDGSLDKLFNESPLIQDTLSELKLLDRNFFYLCNHTLQRDAQVEFDEYWFKPWPENIKACQRALLNVSKIK